MGVLYGAFCDARSLEHKVLQHLTESQAQQPVLLSYFSVISLTILKIIFLFRPQPFRLLFSVAHTYMILLNFVSVGVVGNSTSIWSRANSHKSRSSFELTSSKFHFPFLNFAQVRTDLSTAQYPKCGFRQSYVFINVRSARCREIVAVVVTTRIS